jgi:hypothetical protein
MYLVLDKAKKDVTQIATIFTKKAKNKDELSGNYSSMFNKKEPLN